MDMDGSQPLPRSNPEPPSPLQQMMLFVQSVKGAPASVLLALGFSGTYMSHQELQVWTRCGHAQITAAVRVLVAGGWVVKRTHRGPWALAPGRELPVQFSLGEAGALKALDDDDDSVNLITEEPSSSSARREHSRTQHLRRLMELNGIQEPTATELAELPHVDEAYVQGHLQAARARGMGLGIAILRMRMGVPIPSKAPDGHTSTEQRAAEVADKIRRFMEGR